MHKFGGSVRWVWLGMQPDRMLLYSIMNGRQRSLYDIEREVDFAIAVDGGRRFRVNAYHQKGRMAAALRAIPNKPPDAKSLGIPDEVMDHAQIRPSDRDALTTLAARGCLVGRFGLSADPPPARIAA